jgi:hypothetical protein
MEGNSKQEMIKREAREEVLTTNLCLAKKFNLT